MEKVFKVCLAFGRRRKSWRLQSAFPGKGWGSAARDCGQYLVENERKLREVKRCRALPSAGAIPQYQLPKR